MRFLCNQVNVMATGLSKSSCCNRSDVWQHFEKEETQRNRNVINFIPFVSVSFCFPWRHIKVVGSLAKKSFCHLRSWFWTAQVWFNNEGTEVYPNASKDSRQYNSWTDCSRLTTSMNGRRMRISRANGILWAWVYSIHYTVPSRKHISKLMFDQYTSGITGWQTSIRSILALIYGWAVLQSLYFTYPSFPYFTVGFVDCVLVTRSFPDHQMGDNISSTIMEVLEI